MDATQNQLEKAQAILAKHISAKRLTLDTELRLNSAGIVVIDNIVVPKQMRRKGHARSFLQDLKLAGIQIDICQPKKKSLPFWQNMYKQKLIPHPPEQYTSWENS